VVWANHTCWVVDLQFQGPCPLEKWESDSQWYHREEHFDLKSVNVPETIHPQQSSPYIFLTTTYHHHGHTDHDREQRSQHDCRVTGSSFCQGFIPMNIILQQSPLGAERFTLLTIHCAKVFKWSWSSDCMQKQTHAKTLEVERMYCIDPAIGVRWSDAWMIRHRSALFAPVPHLPLGVPRVILWPQAPGKVVLLAEVKEGSQCCFSRICSSFFKVGICEVDSLSLC
jgi:hypothetical protein